MRMKRFIAAILTASTLLTPLPAAVAAVQDPPFLDVSDPVLSEKLEFLRVMGVVNGKGDGSIFDPEGTFTRAEFVKMAVCALERSEEEPTQRNRTIFLDVGPTFWARGYINLASTLTIGTEKNAAPLVMGAGDGRFYPERAITYGEAVAILTRVLSYVTDNAVGGAWYDSYLAVGKKAKLTQGLSLPGDSVLTRAQAAQLFYNLYFSDVKGTTATYLSSVGGSETAGAVILDTNATADDGSTGCVRTTAGTYKVARTFSSLLNGKEGSLYLNKKKELVAFREKEGVSDRAFAMKEVKSSYVRDADGEKREIDGTVTTYWRGKSYTWEGVYTKLVDETPLTATLHFNENGVLSYVYFPSVSDGEKATAMVCRSVPRIGANPFQSMTQGQWFIMEKNGILADTGALRQYDVGVWDPAFHIIRVCDMKLTGILENAYPNPKDPTRATVMGHEFEVLPSGRDDLASFQVGQRVTLLLTGDNQVAGAVNPDVVSSDAVGLASISGGKATVTLLETGLTVSGEVPTSLENLLHNQLVKVNSTEKGKLNLTGVSGYHSDEPLEVNGDRLGEREVCENVKVFDRVSSSALVKVKYSSLPPIIPQKKISCILNDYAGRVKLLVLDDATGDAYQYGYFRTEKGADEEAAGTLCVRMADSDGKETVSPAGIYMGSVPDTPGGLALDSGRMVAAVLPLQSATQVSRSQLDPEEMTAMVSGVLFPIAEGVQVYNKSAKAWFVPGKEGVEAARVYAETMTLWYDRSPNEGGKIRLIEVW